MLEVLQKLQDADAIASLDAAFGEWIARWGGEPVALAGALTSAEVARSRVCLDLAAARDILQAQEIDPPARWEAALKKSEAVAAPGERAPLVLEDGRLYLHRYWTYETRIAEILRELSVPTEKLDIAGLKKALHEQFPDVAKSKLDRQALAAAIGSTQRLTIISGGPGTGKTTTVGKLIEVARRLNPNLVVALAAPTGKAAARLGEVFSGSTVSPAIEPQTLHRLLGYNAATQRIRHDAGNPLAADLVVVDEASMVDIGLMARLLAALKPDARLVLVGDRDQLASVEAGAVFGDICGVAAGFPEPDAARLEAALGAPVPRAEGGVSPVSANIALLKRNYRFGNEGIGALAQAVVAGDADKALQLLKGGSPSARVQGKPVQSSPSPLGGEGRGEGNQNKSFTNTLALHPITNERQLTRELERIAQTYFKPVLRANDSKEALDKLNRFRLLAAERRGVFGVEGLNVRVESLLGVYSADRWYQGRPVLVTENDYELEVFNGDFGIVWPDAQGYVRLWLASADGTLRSISPARLPAHETAWALTVHKAQGSEFDRVTVVLPPRQSAVATRELVYTGVSRAREAVEVWAAEAVLQHAIETPIRRPSGLAVRLSLA